MKGQRCSTQAEKGHLTKMAFDNNAVFILNLCLSRAAEKIIRQPLTKNGCVSIILHTTIYPGQIVRQTQDIGRLPYWAFCLGVVYLYLF